MKSTEVYNMANNTIETYCCAPVEALISAAILSDKRTGDLTRHSVRRDYRKKIRQGRYYMYIGDIAVKLS